MAKRITPSIDADCQRGSGGLRFASLRATTSYGLFSTSIVKTTHIPRKFSLPPGDKPERTPPQSIVHGCDYHLAEREFEYFYNYLAYEWSIGGRTVQAQAYLDRAGLPEVSVDLTFEELDDPRYAGLLDYLQRRYAIIKTREESGDMIGWIWDAVRPNALKQPRQSRAQKRGVRHVHPSGKRRRPL